MPGGCKELSNKNLKSTSDCPKSKKDTKDCDDSNHKSKQEREKCGKSTLKCKKDTYDCGKEVSKSTGFGKDAFGRTACPQEKKIIECHESVKKFFDGRDKTCDKSDEETSEFTEESEGPKEETDCEGSFKKCEKERESGKKGGFCKHFGKKYVKFDQNTKNCSTSDEDNDFKMPEPQVMTVKPCLPKIEKGISRKRKIVSSCISTENCPHLKKPKKTEFFCIDARNTNMTECIKQYMKSDPTKINIQCAQFIKKRMHTVAQDPTACGLQCSPTLTPSRAANLHPPKLPQLLRRWAPTAGLYVAATALVTVWVTEWDAVIKHIPFYRPKEELLTEKNIPPMTQEEDSGESSSS